MQRPLVVHGGRPCGRTLRTGVTAARVTGPPYHSGKTGARCAWLRSRRNGEARVTSCHVAARSGTLSIVADHYTLRLAPGIRQRLTEWARRTGLPERSLAQRYVEEGLRHDAHPLIQFLDGPSGRRASLVGRGLDVWEVIATVRDNDGSLREAAEYLEVPIGLVEAAVAYYGEYRDEIDRDIELNEAEYERGQAAIAAGEQALRG